jgi:DNA or RNA helicases of superfamily II
MIDITNNFIVINKNDKLYNTVEKFFIKIDKGRIIKLYDYDKNNNIVILRGLLDLLNFENDRCSFNEIRTLNFKPDISLSAYEDLIDGYTLRKDQCIAIRKVMIRKRGLIQYPTGTGKTFILAGILKYLYRKLGYYPTTIILEPTVRLIQDNCKRLNDYGIPVVKYDKVRNNVEGKVIITHPQSLCNDLEKDNTILNSVKVFIGDEWHHGSADTWKSIFINMPTVEMSIGVSATLFMEDRLPITSVNSLSFEEISVIGCTGNILANIPLSYFQKLGILAKSNLIHFNNKEKIEISDITDWHNVRELALESDIRSELIASVANVLKSKNLRTIIVTSTKRHACKIIKYLGNRDDILVSFGMNKYYIPENDNLKELKLTTDERLGILDSSKYKIIIGTTHLMEGADIKFLDAVILGSVGKKFVKPIQSIGRVLRTSKNSKSGDAFLIDFLDIENSLLSKHSDERFGVFKAVLKLIEKENYFQVSDIKDFENVIDKLEK